MKTIAYSTLTNALKADTRIGVIGTTLDIYHNPGQNSTSVTLATIREATTSGTSDKPHEGYLDSIIDALINETTTIKTNQSNYVTSATLSGYVRTSDISDFITASYLTKEHLPNDILYNGDVISAASADQWINTFTESKSRIETLANIFKSNSYSNQKSLEARIEESEANIENIKGSTYTSQLSLSNLDQRITSVENQPNHVVIAQSLFDLNNYTTETINNTIFFIYDDSENPVVYTPSITINTQGKAVSVSGETVQISVTHNCPWTASVTGTGATLNTNEGGIKGASTSSTITLTIPANSDTQSAKTYTVSITNRNTTDGSASDTVTFTQPAAEAVVVPTATISTSSQTISADGGDVTLSIDANPNDLSWIISNNITSATQTGTGDANNIVFTIPARDALTTRNVIFTVKQQGDDTNVIGTYSITQAATTPQLTVSPSTMTFDENGGSKAVTITKAPSDLQVSVSVNPGAESDQNWISYTNGNVVVSTYNVESGSRSGSVSFTYENITRTITVTQTKQEAFVINSDVSELEDVSPTGGTYGPYTVTSTVPFKIDDNFGISQILVDGTEYNDGTIAAGQHSIQLVFNERTVDDKYMDIQFINASTNEILETVSIGQKMNESSSIYWSTYSPYSNGIPFSDQNSTKSVIEIDTDPQNIGWYITKGNDANANLISFVRPAALTNDPTRTETVTDGEGYGVQFNISQNTTDHDITIPLTLWTTDGSYETATITLLHDTATPTITVSPSSYTITSSNASASSTNVATVTVSNNAAWTATTDSIWVTPTNDGNGHLMLTWTENTSTSFREAEITISAGGVTESFFVSQNGKEETPTPTTITLGQDNYQINDAEPGYGDVSVTVSDGSEWTINNNSLWLKTINNGDSIHLAWDENESTESRSTTVTISANGATATLTVTQVGAEETPVQTVMTISPDISTYSIQDVNASSAATSIVTVTVNDGSAWTVNDDADWLTTEKSGNDVTLQWTQNTTYSNRQATVTITSSKTGSQKTITVIQPGAQQPVTVAGHMLSVDGGTLVDVNDINQSSYANTYAQLSDSSVAGEKTLSLASGHEYTFYSPTQVNTPFAGTIEIVKNNDDYEDTRINLQQAWISTSQPSAIKYTLDPNVNWSIEENKSKRRGLIVHSKLCEFGESKLIVNSGETNYVKEDGQAGAIDSANNLTIEGSGALMIQNKAGHAVRAQGDLTLASVDVVADVSHDAFHSNDSLKIENGDFYIQKAHTIFDANDAMYVIKPSISLKEQSSIDFAFKCENDGTQNNIYVLETPESLNANMWTYSAPSNAVTNINTNNYTIRAFTDKPSSWDSTGGYVLNVTPDPSTGVISISGSSNYYNYFVLSGEFTNSIAFSRYNISDVTVVLDGVYAHNNNATNPFIYNGADSQTASSDEYDVNVIIPQDVLNKIDWKYTTNNGSDLDAIKSEGNIKVEPKAGSLTYITSTADCIDGKDVTVTDGAGDLVLYSISERGIKGNNVCIGANLSSKGGVWSLKGTDGNINNDSFGGILIARKHGEQQAIDTTSTDTAKASGYAGIYARNGKGTKGYFAIVQSQFTGKGMIIASGFGAVTNYSAFETLQDVQTPNYTNMPTDRIQVWYPNVFANGVSGTPNTYSGSRGTNGTFNNHVWFTNN